MSVVGCSAVLSRQSGYAGRRVHAVSNAVALRAIEYSIEECG